MIYINATLILIFLIVWVLVFALTKLFFNPVRKIMEERETKIQETKDACQETLRKCERGLEEIDNALRSARAASEMTKQKLEAEALKEKNRFLVEINADYKSQVKKAKTELDMKMKGLKKELKSKAGILAQRIEKKLLS